MSLQRYKVKKRKLKEILLLISILLIFLIWILPNVIIKCFYENDTENIVRYEDVLSVKNEGLLNYNIGDLIKLQQIQNTNYIDFNDENITYTNKENVSISLPEEIQENKYKVEIYLNNEKQKEEEISKQTENIDIEIDKEQENTIKVSLLKNEEILEEKEKKIYYIKPYEKQFLDEYSIYGTQVNYGNGTREKYDTSLEMIKNIGFKNIRASLLPNHIWNSNGKYNYDYYDEWIEKVNESDINILGLICNVQRLGGIDKKINEESENQALKEYILNLKERYGDKIKLYEILNEPNYGADMYITEDDIKNYSNLVNCISEDVDNIVVGATSGSLANVENRQYGSLEFFKVIGNDTYKNTSIYSLHPYDAENYGNVHTRLNTLNKDHKDYFNDLGGFINMYATEYGLTSSTSVAPNGMDEDTQASKIVEQSSIMNKYNVKLAIQYIMTNTGTDETKQGENYGLLNNDYTPKKSFYAMKNFLTNINGAEFVGNLNIANDLEAHLYNKDGKPKIIMWSTNKNATITIPYQEFTAKDIYGNDIQADETDNLKVTTSPVYLDNISRKYFYQAISNTMTEKWAEFEEKFTEQISQVPELQQKIIDMKQIAQEIGTHSEESEIPEDRAIELMNKHYVLGNLLIEAYKNETLKVEDVKLSSMLDMLDDIGNSFEDLVTITAQTRNANFEETSKKIETAENVINNGEDLDNIYPSKILDFAKDFNEKATYINSLEEENDIKTGLIVSKNLHANLLADWSKQFADVYIDKYLQENPVQEITYATEDGQEYKIENLTNKNVIATLPTTDDMQITSEGGNVHTFEHNDSFTFKYTRRGRNFEVVANVKNIDKDAPIITGVEDNKLYTSQVSVNVEDKNLKDVKVICNDEEIKYTLNTPLKEEGIYEIEATDKAENTTKKVFQLIENASENYNIGDKYITNIKGGTTSKELRENLLSSIDYDIKRNDKTLENDEIIRTGDTIETKDMHQKYTLIVAGNINKNGEVDIRDLIRLRKYLLGQIQLDELEKLAADANVDNKEISIKDFVRIRILILSK